MCRYLKKILKGKTRLSITGYNVFKKTFILLQTVAQNLRTHIVVCTEINSFYLYLVQYNINKREYKRSTKRRMSVCLCVSTGYCRQTPGLDIRLCSGSRLGISSVWRTSQWRLRSPRSLDRPTLFLPPHLL